MSSTCFLDPLDVYVKEIHRVLKPQGMVMFGCKFGAIENAPESFVNKEEAKIVATMEECGFKVTSTTVELEKPKYSYSELKGVKKG